VRALSRSVLALLSLSSVLFAQSGEFRGIWVSRFEWVNRDPARCQAKIDEIMRTLAEHRFNAVVFQVRGQCDTLYPSPEEPWSPLISPDGQDPGWDPLAYAIAAAHAHNLEFHAYINTHVAWQASKRQVPKVASHIFFKHFNDADPDACDWVIHNKEGKPATWGGDSYVWIAPGVPAAQAYTRRQVMYVVQNYDVDGVHFDRIRTPTADVSYDPISVARMQPGAEGNPAGLEFAAWTADQFTRFLCDLYAQINEVKPHIRVSSAPLGLVSHDRYPDYPAGFQYAVTKCNQDAQAWLAAGAMDFIAPQIYWSDSDNKRPDFSHVLPDWLAHAAGRHICPGQSTGVGIAELISQVRVTRQSGGAGNIVFSYGSFKEKKGFAQYTKAGLYAEPVATPAMPWKDAPSDGIIIGRVTDAHTGEPLVDAQIRRAGSDHVALSSADGLYSFLKVPPGRYTLTVTKADYPAQTIDNIVVTAGQVVRVEVALGGEPLTVAVAEPRESTRAPVVEEPSAKSTDTDATETDADEAEATAPDEEPLGADAAEAYDGSGRVTARRVETVVTAERPVFIKYVLIALMIAGAVVLAAAIVVFVTSRRNSQ